MNDTIFREISSQVAKDVEERVRQSMQSNACDASSKTKSKSSNAKTEGSALDSKMSQEMFEKISSEVSTTIAQTIASRISSGMGSQKNDLGRAKQSAKVADSKVQLEFSREIDGLVSSLEGSITVILDLLVEDAIQADQARKKLLQLKSKFRSDLDELMQKRDWKMDFLNS